jgi:histidine ammonia-lyase
MLDNTGRIVAIELLAAAQGIEFLRPLRSSAALEEAHALLRELSPSVNSDRRLAPEIERAADLVESGRLTQIAHRHGGLDVLKDSGAPL